MTRIQFENVSFGFMQEKKNSFLQNFTISFKANEMTVLTGPTGCGKSTILNLAAGIYPENAGILHSGKVKVNDKNISRLSPDQRASLIGLMFQNPDLQFCMDTVENEILFCLGNINTPREQMPHKVKFALDFCNITHLRNRKLHTLSGGEKQKAMLACIVALDPKWILLDEPFANIDEGSAKELAMKIAELHIKGKGILIIDHQLDYWLPVASEIRFMDLERQIENKGFPPDKLSNEMLINMGIKPPAIPYKENVAVIGQMEDDRPILQLDNVQVLRNKNPILKNIRYIFQRKRIYAILGASGSGKSTLFGAITGLHKYNGSILLDGKNLKKRSVQKKGQLGFITQNPHDQFVTNTVLDEINFGIHHKKGKEQVELILRNIGLWKYRNFSPYMLSQGQQRRLGVASSMLYDYQVLICDEPTYAQDWRSTMAIMDLLMKNVLKHEMTLIFSTHDRELAHNYADIILTLKEGKIIECAQSSF